MAPLTAKPLKDGGGIASTADWKHPQSGDMLSSLRRSFLQLMANWQLVRRLQAHVAQSSRQSLLTNEEVEHLRRVVADFLSGEGLPCSTEVAAGQPLTLDLWRGLLSLCNDVDLGLPSLLKEGVRTGIQCDIPPSGVWRPVNKPERPDVELEVLQEPWGSALNDPACLMKLVEADVRAGFASWLPGGLPEARALWPQLRCREIGLSEKSWV